MAEEGIPPVEPAINIQHWIGERVQALNALPEDVQQAIRSIPGSYSPIQTTLIMSFTDLAEVDVTLKGINTDPEFYRLTGMIECLQLMKHITAEQALTLTSYCRSIAHHS